jgi:hypothetical protein
MSGSFDNAIAYGKRRGTAAPEQDSSGGFAGEIDSGDYAEDIATE